MPDTMGVRQQTVEHPFGTIKARPPPNRLIIAVSPEVPSGSTDGTAGLPSAPEMPCGSWQLRLVVTRRSSEDFVYVKGVVLSKSISAFETRGGLYRQHPCRRY
jgi:hypothetical protein